MSCIALEASNWGPLALWSGEAVNVQGLDDILSAIASLTPAQQAVLSAVSNHCGPVAITDLARECGLHVNTIREPLNVLVSLRLVERERMPVTGRGRPSWGYVNRTLSGPGSPVDLLRHLARSTITWIHNSCDDPITAGLDLGRHLGDDALAAAKVPDHSTLAASPQFSLAAHMTKIRIFLTAFGFSAEPHPSLPTALVLRTCPFVDPGYSDPVALAVQRGMLLRVMECTAGNLATATIRQDADTMNCELILNANHVE